MSYLASVTTGIAQTGSRIIFGGGEKMGKTSLCAGMPDALLIPCEVGYGGIDMPKVNMIQSWEALCALTDEITLAAQAGTFRYKTICFDSATAVERFIHAYILSKDPQNAQAIQKGLKLPHTMESAHGGYGKAYNMANMEFDNWLLKLDALAVHGKINIVMTCHVFTSTVKDATVGEYQTWDLLLHSPKNEKSYGKRERISQWADIIGFLYEPVFVATSGDKQMSRATSQGKGRVLGISRTPNYVAGNRYGMVGEIPLPNPTTGQNPWNPVARSLWEATAGSVDLYNRAKP